MLTVTLNICSEKIGQKLNEQILKLYFYIHTMPPLGRTGLIKSIKPHGKLIKIIIIQVYVPTTNPEDEIESLYTSIQEDIDYTPK